MTSALPAGRIGKSAGITGAFVTAMVIQETDWIQN
jgi:hypothetical protein